MGKKTMSRSKILVLDIETAPTVSFTWGLWQQNVGLNQIVKDMNILCWAAKWLEDDYVYYDALHFHKKRWQKEPDNDIEILKSAWAMLDEADYVLAHNAKFDVNTLNSRFIQQGMQPPSTYKLIDTLRIAKQNFRFTSNKLAYIGDKITDDVKMDPGGFETWKSICLDRCTEAFDHLMDYNIQDVDLLEEVYLKLRAWDKKHANLANSTDLSEVRCNVCGSQSIKNNGYYFTNTQEYKRFRCKDCGHTMRAAKAEKRTKEQKSKLLRSV